MTAGGYDSVTTAADEGTTTSSSATTPAKRATSSMTTDGNEPASATLLSPTPYWKVLEGRDGGRTRTSPRTKNLTKKEGVLLRIPLMNTQQSICVGDR